MRMRLEQVGPELKKLREELNLMQKDLKHVATQHYISDVESGKRHVSGVTLGKLQKWFNALGYEMEVNIYKK